MRIRWAWVWLGWGVMALVFSVQNVVGALASGANVDWSWAVYHEFVYWSVWGALTPVIVVWSRRFRLGRGDGWGSWGRHLALAAVIAPLHVAVAYALHGVGLAVIGTLPLADLGGWLAERRVGFLVLALTGFWKYGAVVGVYYAFDYYQRWQREQEQSSALALRTARLEGQLARSKLAALRSQLRPHFLFNTLSSIAVLVREAPEDAEAMIHRLSRLLRTTLEREGDEEVSLGEELDFLERYLEIQRMRFEDRLEVTLDVDPEARGLRVPFLILQPLVENALDHGLDAPGRGVAVTVEAHRRGDRLRLAVRDRPREAPVRPSTSGRDDATGGRRAPESDGAGGTGRGLSTLRERLARVAIRRELERMEEVELIGECSDGEEAVRAIRELDPDLVFLDVRMPGMDGFDVVRTVGVEAMPPVIFVTAHDEHATRAFDVNAVDYVLKPIEPDRLETACRRALDRMTRGDRDVGRRLSAVLDRLEALEARAAGEEPSGETARATLHRLTVEKGGRISFVDVDDVRWLESATSAHGPAVHRAPPLNCKTSAEPLTRIPRGRVPRPAGSPEPPRSRRP